MSGASSTEGGLHGSHSIAGLLPYNHPTLDALVGGGVDVSATLTFAVMNNLIPALDSAAMDWIKGRKLSWLAGCF